MNFTRLAKLDNLITNTLKRKPTIILDPNPEHSFRIKGTVKDLSVSIDTDIWTLPDDMDTFIMQLNETNCSIEEKILKIYEKLCQEYTYDDNVLTYIKKNDDDTFFLPDAYGRDTDSSWKEKRKQHNRRSCFEISRILAKSIIEMLKTSGKSKNFDVCILWDEAVTHYFVGLISNEYTLSLDLDDFTQIKDLTREKTELSIIGIRILEDNQHKFEEALKRFNSGKSEEAKDHIQNKIDGMEKSTETEIENEDDNNIEFLKYSVKILKEEYNLDSAGIYEFLKEIVDTKIGARSRRKVWKEVKDDNNGIGKRYTRCLIITIDDIQYIIDVTKESAEEIFRVYDSNGNGELIPFNKMSRNWNEDPYDGR